MGNVDRKASKREMEHAYSAIKEAFPDCEPVFGGHSAYSGHRAPRDHTISFRLRNAQGNFCSNVVWVRADALGRLTAENVRELVSRANGKGSKRRK